MNVNELKRELSKVSGVDFFNPKYRNIFKKHMEAEREQEESAEAPSNDKQDVPVSQSTEQTSEENVPVEEANPDNETSSNKDSTESTSNNTEEEESDTQEEEEIPTQEESTKANEGANVTEELQNTKLELELVRAGIREDRLETAKRLFLPEFKASGGDRDQIRELIAQYPEWISKGATGGTQGFGMPLGERADELTNEEKALKRMGIDPRR